MIKIRLEKWENTVIMQVLEMDDQLRGVGDIFRSHNGFALRSKDEPGLFMQEIYVCGTVKHCDSNVSFNSFGDNRARDSYYNKIVELFYGYNNREKQEEHNIFILK